MERPLLTFDLDGVLCRPPLGINPGSRKAKSRERTGRRNLLWLTERWRYRRRQPMPGAVADFRLLNERFECHILSARGGKARRSTERWFRRHFGEVPTIHLRPSWRETPAQFKARMVAELHPIAHFEDDPHTAHWLAEILPAVFLVDWRRNRWLETPNIRRILRLADALAKLDQLAAEPAPNREAAGLLWTGDLLRGLEPAPNGEERDGTAGAPPPGHGRDDDPARIPGQPPAHSPSPAQSGEAESLPGG